MVLQVISSENKWVGESGGDPALLRTVKGVQGVVFGIPNTSSRQLLVPASSL